MIIRLALAYMVAAAALVGCGDDPVSYSAPVGINLKAKSSDVVMSVVSDEKGITTESGNPYGKFISDAQAALGGNDPSSIELSSLELLLGANSTGVTTLEEIFAGNVEVLFVMNDTDNTFPVGNVMITAPVGGGPLAMNVSFDSADFQGTDRTKLLAGSFKVVIRGPAATDFTTKGADADLQVTFVFEAFE